LAEMISVMKLFYLDMYPSENSGKCSWMPRKSLNWRLSLMAGIRASSWRYCWRVFLLSSIMPEPGPFLPPFRLPKSWMLLYANWKELAGNLMLGYWLMRFSWSVQKFLYFWWMVQVFPLKFTCTEYSVYVRWSTGSSFTTVCWMLRLIGI